MDGDFVRIGKRGISYNMRDKSVWPPPKDKLAVLRAELVKAFMAADFEKWTAVTEELRRWLKTTGNDSKGNVYSDLQREHLRRLHERKKNARAISTGA